MIQIPFLSKATIIGALLFTAFLCKFIGEGMEGRIGRKRYLLRQFVIAAAFGVIYVFTKFADINIVRESGQDVTFLFVIICCTVFVSWFCTTTDIRRLHDFNRSALYLVVIYVVLAGLGLSVSVEAGLIGVAVFRLLMVLIPGSKRPNDFGYNHDKNYIF